MIKRIIPILCIFCCLSCGQEKTSVSEKISTAEAPRVELTECFSSSYTPEFESFATIGYVKKADVYPMSSEIIREMRHEEGEAVRRGDILVSMDRKKLEIQMREAEAGVRIQKTKLNLAIQQLEEGRRNMEAQFYSIASCRLDLKKTEADYERIKKVHENKRQLLELEGISQEEMESVDLQLFEQELALEQAGSDLAVKMIGYRDEDLLKAGYDLPEDDAEKKELFIDYNTRMLKAEVDVARAELEAAESQMETLELYIEETLVRAPISGIVGRKYMEEGEKASTDKPLYLIYPENSVYAQLEVSERDLEQMHTGLEALVRTDGKNKEFPGEIHRISPWVQEETRTAVIKILLDNRESHYKVGQFVKVKILLSEKTEALLVPREAVLSGDGESIVYIYRGGRIFKTAVECGDPLKQGIPIYSGIQEGDKIILSPRESFRDGMEVLLL